MSQERLAKAGYLGMNQDISKKSPERVKFYYQGRNLTIIFNGATGNGVAQNEKGNTKLVTLPNIIFAVNPDTVKKASPGPIYTESTLPDTVATQFITTYNTDADVAGWDTAVYGLPGTPIIPSASDVIQYSYMSRSLDVGIAINVHHTGQKIIGATKAREKLILFSTNGSLDCIWEVTYDYDYDPTITLKYVGDANFSVSNPIKAISNYENENIHKVYWVDGKRNQGRHFNFAADSPHNTYTSNLNSTPEATFTQPVIAQRIPGGNLSAGIVQYAYNYFNLNGSQSKLSPLSHASPVHKDGRGLAVNEDGGDSFRVTIDSLDARFDYVRLYRIHYLNESGTPSITILSDTEIDTVSLSFVDDGDAGLGTSSVSEFTQLGAGPYYPNTLESKDNYLFYGNVQEQEFDVTDFDTRAYAFPKSSTTSYIFSGHGARYTLNGATWKLTSLLTNGVTTALNENVAANHDAINPSIVPTLQDETGTITADPTISWLDTAAQLYWSGTPAAARDTQFQYNSTTLGAKGPNITLEWRTDKLTAALEQPKERNNYIYRSYKTGEVYRFAIVFYNKFGQKTFANWIGDFKVPTLEQTDGVKRGTSSFYNHIFQDYNPVVAYPRFTVNNLSDLRDAGVVSYSIVRMERSETDKGVISQGIINPLMYSDSSLLNFTYSTINHVLPMRSIADGTVTRGTAYAAPSGRYYATFNSYIDNTDTTMPQNVTTLPLSSEEITSNQTVMRGDFFSFYSPDTMFDNSFEADPSSTRIRFFGQILGEKYNTQLANFSTISGNPFAYKQVVETASDNATRWADHFYLGQESADFYGDDFGAASRHKAYAMMSQNAYLYDNAGVAQWDSPYLVEGSVVGGSALNVSIGDGARFEEFNNRYYLRYDVFGVNKRDMIGLGARTLIAKPYNNADYFNYVVSNGHFEASTYSASAATAKSMHMLVEYVKPVGPGRYNGWTYEARQTNSYVEAGAYTDISTGSTSTINVRNGDTFIDMFRIMKTSWYSSASLSFGSSDVANHPGGTDSVSCQEWLSFPLETKYNLAFRADKSRDNVLEFEADTADYQEYNNVYHRTPNAITFPAKPLTFQEVVDFDVITRYSDVKFNNEETDSWTVFRTNNFQECDTTLGAITGFYKFNDAFVVTQENGIGLWLINPTAVSATSEGAIILGTGGILQDYVIKSTIYGTRHRFGAIVGKRSVYVMDTDNKKFISVVEDPNVGLSDIKGMYSFFDKQLQNESVLNGGSPLETEGVMMGYDPDTYNVYLTVFSYNRSSGGGGEDIAVEGGGEIVDSQNEVLTDGTDGEDGGVVTATSGIDYSFTLSYNEISQSFVALHDYLPKIYFNDHKHLFTGGNTSGTLTTDAWIHNYGDYGNYYGTTYNSYVRHLLAPDADYNKVWNYFEYNMEVYNGTASVPGYQLASYRCWNTKQDTTTTSLDLTLYPRRSHKHFNEWRIPVGRDINSRNQRQRMYNPWQYYQLNIDNSLVSGNSYRYIIHDLMMAYQLAMY